MGTQSAGSGTQVKLIADLNSAAFQELVDQLNQSEIPIGKTLTEAGGVGGKVYVLLGRTRAASWIRELSIANLTDAALANAATDILIRHCAADEVDFVNGPDSVGTPVTILDIEGFGNNMPANTALWGREFVALTNCDAKTGDDRGAVVPAGRVIYAELVNTEAAAVTIEVTAMMTPIDFLNLQPGGLQNQPHVRARDFERKPRGRD